MPIDSKAAAQVPVTFVYRAEGPSSSVRLTGCFLSWSSAGVPCERSAENLFSTVQLLPPGSRVLFKFIVDGAWVCSPSYPISDDGAGNRNNVLDVMAPLGGGGGGGSPRSPPSGASAAGSPSYTHEGRFVPPTGNLELFPPTSEPASYIGHGVMKEYSEEFGLVVSVAAQKPLLRSASMSTLETTADSSWLRRGPGGGAPLRRSLAQGAAATGGGGRGGEGGGALAPLLEVPGGGEGEAEAPRSVDSVQSEGDLGGSRRKARATSENGPALVAAAVVAAAAAVPPSSAGRCSPSTHGGLLLSSIDRAVGLPVALSEEEAAGVLTSPRGAAAGFPAGEGGGGGGSGGGSSGGCSSAATAPTAAAVAAAATAASGFGGTLPSRPPTLALPLVLTPLSASMRRDGRLVLALAGLPARGKTFIARHVKRHLMWMGYKVEIFNVGNYRRRVLGAAQLHDFFNPDNTEGNAQRRAIAAMAFEDMVATIKRDGLDVAIFDATNTTVERRTWLRSALAAADPTLRLVFIEPMCSDEAIIRANVRETKLKSPDYKGMDEAAAVADFLERIKHYEKVYEPVGDTAAEVDVPYVKLIDMGRKLQCNRINNYLPSRVMFFLSNLQVTPRPIWLTRHGESEFNVLGKIGGDSALSLRGAQYAMRLATFFNKLYPRETSELVVWTSTLMRTQLTAAHIGREVVAWKALDEIDAGICDGAWRGKNPKLQERLHLPHLRPPPTALQA
jgi:hypothetical protein